MIWVRHGETIEVCWHTESGNNYEAEELTPSRARVIAEQLLTAAREVEWQNERDSPKSPQGAGGEGLEH